ncbi:MAG: hypothetical protein AMXMBFR47_43380 [Planctomycetota bacterium]
MFFKRGRRGERAQGLPARGPRGTAGSLVHRDAIGSMGRREWCVASCDASGVFRVLGAPPMVVCIGGANSASFGVNLRFAI